MTATCLTGSRPSFGAWMAKATPVAFADFSQWEDWQAEQQEQRTKPNFARLVRRKRNAAPAPVKKKLSYLDSRDFETIEDRISTAEEVLAVEASASRGQRSRSRSEAIERSASRCRGGAGDGRSAL